MSIASSVEEFNSIFSGFRDILAPPDTPRPSGPSAPAAPIPAAPAPSAAPTYLSPSRKVDAVIRAQNLESHLSASDLRILINIVGMDTGKANIYNALLNDELRINWVQDQLQDYKIQNGLDLIF